MTRRANAVGFEYVMIDFDHALAAATFADKLFTAKRAMVFDAIEYINPTGLAADATNHWNIGVQKNGAGAIASWSTETGEDGGALVANAVNAFTVSTVGDRMRADADDVIGFFADKTASAADLPAGRVVIHAHYI